MGFAEGPKSSLPMPASQGVVGRDERGIYDRMLTAEVCRDHTDADRSVVPFGDGGDFRSAAFTEDQHPGVDVACFDKTGR